MTSKTNKLLKRSVLRPTCIDPYPQKAYTLEIYLHTKYGDKRHHLGETRAEIKSKHHLGRQFDNDLGKQALFCSIISISTNMECRIESMLSCKKYIKILFTNILKCTEVMVHHKCMPELLQANLLYWLMHLNSIETASRM